MVAKQPDAADLVTRYLAKPVRYLLLLTPLFAAIWLSFGDSLRAGMATMTLNPSSLAAMNEETALQLRRNIQQHYRQYGLHLPIEDIVVVSKNRDEPDKLTFLMRKACGQGKVYVWVPLKLKLPFLGNRVVEWCWKTTA